MTVSYIRVSTKKQGESGLGLESQRAIIKNYYPEVEKEFMEVESGKDSERPVLKEAIEYCNQNNATLIVAKLDRLSRITEDVLSIRSQLGNRIRFCDIPGVPDKFTITLLAAVAEREGELISIRTRNAMEQKRNKEGEWRKSNGFNPEMREKSKEACRKKAVSNVNNRQAYGIIEDKVKKGMSLTEIANHLNSFGHQTSKKKKFSSNQVKRLIEMFKN